MKEIERGREREGGRKRERKKESAKEERHIYSKVKSSDNEELREIREGKGPGERVGKRQKDME